MLLKRMCGPKPSKLQTHTQPTITQPNVLRNTLANAGIDDTETQCVYATLASFRVSRKSHFAWRTKQRVQQRAPHRSGRAHQPMQHQRTPCCHTISGVPVPRSVSVSCLFCSHKFAWNAINRIHTVRS